jgi:Tfp pilus assembly protein PilF
MTGFKYNSIAAALKAVGLVVLIAYGAAIEAYAFSPSSQTSTRGNRVEALIAEGAQALERGDVSGAKASFERALEINNKNAEAHTYLGAIADRAGQLREAERHFAAAVAADPGSATAHNNYGAILLKQGLAERAAAEFEASLRLNSKQPSALANLAQIHFSSGAPEGLREAQRLFERAQELAGDIEIARALVVIALKLNDVKAAAASYRQYAERLTAAPETASTETASAASRRKELGNALLEAGLLSEAIEELTAAVSLEPSDIKAIISLARAYMLRKDIRSAGRALELAVARGINSGQIYAALAEVYEASGHIENAIPAMRLAIEQEPDNEDYRFRYGMILTDTKAPAAAIIRLEEALKIFPGSVKLWFALGVAHSMNYASDEAATAFERAIELDPVCAPALAYLGLTRAEKGDLGHAIALYERALKSDDNLAAAHFLAADAMLKQSPGDTSKGEAHLKRALALDNSFSPARLALAKLYARDGRLKEAVVELERVVADEPGMAEAHYQLGRAYVRLKRKAEGDGELEKFKKLSETEKEQAQNERQRIMRRLANVRF